MIDGHGWRHPRCADGRGFTLLELMMVVAVVGILVSLALPSYQHYMLRAHRSQALGQLLRVAACQERLRAAGGRYDTRRCLPGDAPRYRYAYLAADGGPADAYTIMAYPLGAQAGDPCGAMGIDQAGRKLAPAAPEAGRCWAAR